MDRCLYIVPLAVAAGRRTCVLKRSHCYQTYCVTTRGAGTPDYFTFRSMTICWNNPPRALQSFPTPLPSIVSTTAGTHTHDNTKAINNDARYTPIRYYCAVNYFIMLFQRRFSRGRRNSSSRHYGSSRGNGGNMERKKKQLFFLLSQRTTKFEPRTRTTPTDDRQARLLRTESNGRRLHSPLGNDCACKRASVCVCVCTVCM